jgi:co-chaperonin GroES (HSP10)
MIEISRGEFQNKTIYPSPNIVIVEKIDEAKKNNIIISAKKENTRKGKVIAIGSAIDENINIDDIVFWNQLDIDYQHNCIRVDEKEYVFLEEQYILYIEGVEQ